MQNSKMYKRKVWLVGGYGVNGGNQMAHHIGLCLKQQFECDVTMVGVANQMKQASALFYQEEGFDVCDITELPDLVQAEDVVISQPSFSKHMLGFKLKGYKIMYIQGFNTFNLLDGFFDEYVCVSPFAQAFIYNTYGIKSQVISAFIGQENFPAPIKWEDKKDEVLIYPKHGKDHFDLFAPYLMAQLDEVGISYQLFDKKRKIQTELFHELNQYRYVLSLSIVEGFGLVPLEAMYLGCIVAGFDGFGGRTFMNATNSVTVAYPNLDQIVPAIQELRTDPFNAKQLSLVARQTASKYTQARFHQEWREFFRSL